MKKRIPILLLAALLLFIAWWLLRTSAKNPAPAPTASKPVETERAAPATSAPAAVAQPTSEQAQEAARLNATRQRGQSSNQPISFYGKVIDQHGEPIPDVKVTLGLRTFKEPAPGVMGDADVSLIRTTNAEGRFEITDAKGSVLEMRSLEKPGYEASIKSIAGRAYRYWAHPSEGPYRPNADAPEIFRMWKKQGAETLLVKSIGRAIPYDGTPTSYDLMTGQPSPNGDVRVTLSRTPRKITWGQTHYDWEVTIEALKGGLIVSDEEQMFLAPEDGYQPMFTLRVPADAQDWTDTKEVAAYLRLRDGKFYGRASFGFMVGSDREGTPIKIRSFVNPTGSRNLEYDPAQGLSKEPGLNPLSARPTP